MNRGFTILELLLVVLVVAVLASITLLAYNDFQEKAISAEAINMASSLKRILQQGIDSGDLHPGQENLPDVFSRYLGDSFWDLKYWRWAGGGWGEIGEDGYWLEIDFIRKSGYHKFKYLKLNIEKYYNGNETLTWGGDYPFVPKN